MSTVLVVGGAGYAGSVLTAALLERGYSVRVLDNLCYGDQGLAEVRDRIEFVWGDIRNPPDDVLDGIESVVNIGGISNDPTADFDPETTYHVNTAASVALARMCGSSGVRRYVYTSSCSVYDQGLLDDIQDRVRDETSVVEPSGAYAVSKLSAERQLLPMSSRDLSISALRLGTLFGFSRRMRYDLVVNTFVKDALHGGRITLHAGGEMWRPLTSVGDAARTCIALLEADAGRVGGEVYNVVYRNFRISELAFRVRTALADDGVPVELEVDYENRGIRNYRVSSSKLNRVLGIQPAFPVEHAVHSMMNEIRRHSYEDFDNPIYYNIAWMRLPDADRAQILQASQLARAAVDVAGTTRSL